jgi:hypothetical protein
VTGHAELVHGPGLPIRPRVVFESIRILFGRKYR